MATAKKYRIRPGFVWVGEDGKGDPNMKEVKDDHPLFEGQKHKLEPADAPRPSDEDSGDDGDDGEDEDEDAETEEGDGDDEDDEDGDDEKEEEEGERAVSSPEDRQAKPTSNR